MKKGIILSLVLVSTLILFSGCAYEKPQTDKAQDDLNTEIEENEETVTSDLNTIANEDVAVVYFTPPKQYELIDYLEAHGERYLYCIYEYGLEMTAERYVVVFDDDKYVATLEVVGGELGSYSEIPDFVLERDVNFDGKKDTLLYLGVFGNQCAAYYKCYLSNGESLEYCPSFSEISNPVIINEIEAVGSTWRNWAASHSWAYYRYLDGEFVETDRLTEYAGFMGDDIECWNWEIEARKDGEMVIVDKFNDYEYKQEEIDAKLSGDNSIWKLDDGERWYGDI